MEKLELEEMKLIGLSLGRKTSNELGQSAEDCGKLWQKFEKGNYAARIPGKISGEILAVYHEYESDHTQPFSYFIGCKVRSGTKTPEGLDSLILRKGVFQKISARGKMPDCVASAWNEIWNSRIARSYTADFEVYDERSKDWNNAEVDIFIAIKE